MAYDWKELQLQEIVAAAAELDSGESVGHEKVSEWLRSWGKPSEGEPPVSRENARCRRR